MKKLFTAILLISGFISSTVSATEIFNTRVVHILTGPQFGNKVFVKVNPSPSGKGCSASGSYDYVFDASTAPGKITLALLLSLDAQQETFWISGYDKCSLHGNVEDLRFVRSN